LAEEFLDPRTSNRPEKGQHNRRNHVKSSTTVLGRWRRFLFAPFSVLAAVTLVTSAASAAQAATVINTDVPVRIVAFNPCNGEALALDGMGHFVFRVAYENNGAVLVGEHYNIHVTGTGDKGNTYVGNSEELSEENAELGLEETTTLSPEPPTAFK
jgi:hypothetical protein